MRWDKMQCEKCGERTRLGIVELVVRVVGLAEVDEDGDVAEYDSEYYDEAIWESSEPIVDKEGKETLKCLSCGEEWEALPLPEPETPSTIAQVE